MFVNRRGFTLIETMVAFGIFAILTAALTANLKAGQKRDELKYTAEKLAQEIRRAANQTLAGIKTDVPGIPTPAVYDGGFGVQFDSTNKKYQTVVDKDDSGSVNPGVDKVFSATTLPSWMSMTLTIFDGTHPSSSFIRFRQPKGVMCVDTKCAQCPEYNLAGTCKTLFENNSSVRLDILLKDPNDLSAGQRTIKVQGITGKVSVE